ncbi:hypothetical protein SNE40_000524 [Patella caerulea]|uniref:Uncharacterized protein n=1 Tax=Patella caerulea TaxID=87958 RepID=A0AAN8KLG2_PATCE
MFVDLSAWRMIIGLYHHKIATSKCKLHKLRITKLTLLVLIVFSCLLLLSGDVESNPGPSTRQGTISRTGELVYPSESSDQGNALASLLQEIKDEISQLRNEVREMNIKEEVANIRIDIEQLRTENEEIKERLEDSENRRKERNLIFYGLEEKKIGIETTSECEQLIREDVIAKLKDVSSDSDVCIERVFRLGKKQSDKTRPILVVFNKLRDSDLILSSGRKQLKDAHVKISEDYSKRVREIRKALIPHLVEAKEANKRAFLKNDKLIIDNDVFSINMATNELSKTGSRR